MTARLALAALAAFATAVLIASPAAAQKEQLAPRPAVALEVPDLQDADLDRWIRKSNASVGLLNASLRAAQSWDRYLSWADLRRGPTGSERIIYGLYSVGVETAKRAAEAARKAAGDAPAIAPLDAAMTDLAQAFETLVPILNEAEAYYDRKDYKADRMEGGKALHARLVPAATAFLAARRQLDAAQEQLKSGLDRQELARIARAEGKSVRWHAKHTMALAKTAVEKMPRDPRRADELPAFDAAVAAFADAVREFDAAVAQSGKSGTIDSFPRGLLGKMRDLREKIGDRRTQPQFYAMDFNNIVSQYNMMISMSNAFR